MLNGETNSEDASSTKSPEIALRTVRTQLTFGHTSRQSFATSRRILASEPAGRRSSTSASDWPGSNRVASASGCVSIGFVECQSWFFMLDVRCLLKPMDANRNSSDSHVESNDRFRVFVTRENVAQFEMAARRRFRNSVGERDIMPKVVTGDIDGPRIVVY